MSLFAAWRSFEDVICVITVVVLVSGRLRKVLALASLIFFPLAFTPYSWPTFWLSLSPLVLMWRLNTDSISNRKTVIEATAIGFVLCWLVTGFVSPAAPPRGIVLHGALSLVFGVQFVGIALTVRWLRHTSILLTAVPLTVMALAQEMIQVLFSPAWSVVNPQLAIANTPIAQWSEILTPFGLSFVFYLMNFLMVPDNTIKEPFCWFGPLLGGVLVGGLWIGGTIIESRVSIQPLPFSALLVQPHLEYKQGIPWQPWKALDPITTKSLETKGRVDLVVWPETSLTPSGYPLESESRPLSKFDINRSELTLQDFQHFLLPKYKTNCLLGLNMYDDGSVIRYGVTVDEKFMFNCGCLVSPSARPDCHEKIKLVPMREGLPWWLNNELVRQYVLPFVNLQAPYSSGRNFHLMRFKDQTNVQRTIAVAICYESWFPWLPQYHQGEAIDAIVYLMYDGDFIDFPELMERQLQSVRLRAIETRTWSLVCSCWRGTAVIDPKGRIVSQLPETSGALRTDLLDILTK